MINLLKKPLHSLLFLLVLVLSPSLLAQQMVVVINAKNAEEITPEMIKQIYSDKRSFWKSGNQILLFELPVKDQRREIFSKALLNKSAIASQSEWSNRYINNTIKNKVKIKPEKLVAKFVSNYQYAIGYISALEAEKQNNLKIIMTINN